MYLTPSNKFLVMLEVGSWKLEVLPEVNADLLKG